MEEKKLTDEEIIKALEHCLHNRSCKCCYHNGEVGSGEIVCRSRLMRKAVALIHRLQDDKYSLEQKLKECELGYQETLYIERLKSNEQKAEIERLERQNRELSKENPNIVVLIDASERKYREIYYEAKDILKEQTEKRTANEIYEILEKWAWKLKNEKGSLGNFAFGIETAMQEIKEKYSLQVANFKLVELKKEEK